MRHLRLNYILSKNVLFVFRVANSTPWLAFLSPFSFVLLSEDGEVNVALRVRLQVNHERIGVLQR